MMRSFTGMMVAVCWGLLVTSAATANDDRVPGWMGFVYPQKSNLFVDRYIGRFDTLAECRYVALRVIHGAGWKNATYECGLDCRIPMNFAVEGTMTCKETMR